MNRFYKIISMFIVSVMMLSIVSISTTAEASEERTYIITTTAGLNMRASATTSSGILTKLPYNTEVTISEINGDWGYTTYGGQSGWISLTYAIESHKNDVEFTSFVYGKSEMGKDLVCYSIAPETYSKTVLAVFAIHGFEDNYAHDGQVLVDTANSMMDYYKSGHYMNDCRLLVVAPANPDGLIDGTTNNGFGRCNANGVDLNRDFDAAHIAYTSVRNYTPYAFSAKESQALRDLYYEYEPDVVLDYHGWLNTTIGDGELARIFKEELNLNHQTEFSTNCHGYLSYWAHLQGSYALLVEFKDPDISMTKVLKSMNRVMNMGDDGSDSYDLDENYRRFANTTCYTLSTGHVSTYDTINGSSTGWIDGIADECIIKKIYANGWVKVQYPYDGGGTKVAYAKLSDFIANGTQTTITEARVAANTKVYRRSDMSETTGSVWATDTFYTVARNGSVTQIIYPLDDGGWKMGWVPSSAIITPTFYTVSYDANGGTNAPAAQLKEEGKPLVLTNEVPQKEGYTFIRWNTEANGYGGTYFAGGTYYYDEDVTMYAEWMPSDLNSAFTWTLDEDGVMTLSGNGAMENYPSADEIPWKSQRDSIKSVVIQEGVTSICDFAFYGCHNIESVSMPTGFTEIGAYAFMNCSALESVSIPDSVIAIGSSAFSLSGLKNVELSANVREIERSAFIGCLNLTGISVDADNPDYFSADGVLYSYDRYGNRQLLCCPCSGVGESFTIPDGVVSIMHCAFHSCKTLKEIVIPDTVTSFDDGAYYAFYECSALKDIYYKGTESEWNEIDFANKYDVFDNITIHFNYGRRIPGDVNNDGEVTTMDATLIKRSIVGGYDLPTFIEADADVNGDGEITTMDATLIKRYIVGGYGVELK